MLTNNADHVSTNVPELSAHTLDALPYAAGMPDCGTVQQLQEMLDTADLADLNLTSKAANLPNRMTTPTPLMKAMEHETPFSALPKSKDDSWIPPSVVPLGERARSATLNPALQMLGFGSPVLCSPPFTSSPLGNPLPRVSTSINKKESVKIEYATDNTVVISSSNNDENSSCNTNFNSKGKKRKRTGSAAGRITEITNQQKQRDTIAQLQKQPVNPLTLNPEGALMATPTPAPRRPTKRTKVNADTVVRNQYAEQQASLVETIDELLIRVQQVSADTEQQLSQLNATDLSHLQLKILESKKEGLIKAVHIDTWCAIVKLIGRILTDITRTVDKQQQQDQPASAETQANWLRPGLSLSGLVLCIMSCEELGKPVLQEESVEGAVTCCKLVSMLLDRAASLGTGSGFYSDEEHKVTKQIKPKKAKPRGKGKGKKAQTSDDDAEYADFQPAKPRKAKKRATIDSVWSDLLEGIRPVLQALLPFVNNTLLHSYQASTLLDLALTCIFLPPELDSNELKGSLYVTDGSFDILRTIFSNYEQLRTDIIDRIVICISDLPTSKDTANANKDKSYNLLYGNEKISIFTALFLQLMQACAPLPDIAALQEKMDSPKKEDPTKGTIKNKKRTKSTAKKGGKKRGKQKSDVDTDLSDEGDMAKHSDEEDSDEIVETTSKYYSSIMDICLSILDLIRLKLFEGKSDVFSSGKADKEERDAAFKFLDKLVDDLLRCLSLPEWPAAEIFLNVLLVYLVRTYINPPAGGSKTSGGGTSLADKMKGKTIEIVGKIALYCRHEKIKVEETKMNWLKPFAENAEVTRFLQDWWRSPTAMRHVNPIKTEEQPLLQSSQFVQCTQLSQDEVPPGHLQIENAHAPIDVDTVSTSAQLPELLDDDRQIAMKSLWQFLSESSGRDDLHGFISARQLMACKWQEVERNIFTHWQRMRAEKSKQGNNCDDDTTDAQLSSIIENRQTFINTLLSTPVNKTKQALQLLKDASLRDKYVQLIHVNRYLSSVTPSCLLHKSRYQYLITCLVLVFQDGNTSSQSKTKAIKCLTKLLQADSSLLTKLWSYVVDALDDNYASVRESVLEMLGVVLVGLHKYETGVIEESVGAGHILGALVDRVVSMLSDKGVSVQKRAANILGQILRMRLLANHSDLYFKCCWGLIKTTESLGTNEPKIPLKDFIVSLFREFWFDIKVNTTSHEKGDVDIAKFFLELEEAEIQEDKRIPALGGTKRQKHSKDLQTAFSLVDLFSQSLANSTGYMEFDLSHPLVQLLRTILLLNDKRLTYSQHIQLRKKWNDLIDVLILFILDRESQGISGAANNNVEVTKESIVSKGRHSNACCIALLHAFSLIDPDVMKSRLFEPLAALIPPISKHAPLSLEGTIKMYHVTSCITQCFRYTDVLLEVCERQATQEIMTPMLECIKVGKFRSGTALSVIIDTAVNCMCGSIKRCGTNQNIMNTYLNAIFTHFIFIYTQLTSFSRDVNQFNKFKGWVLRYLFTMSCYMKHMDWQNRNEQLTELKPECTLFLVDKQNDILEKCYGLLVAYYNMKVGDAATVVNLRRMVIHAFGGICMGVASYWRRTVDMFKGSLNSSSIELKRSALLAVRDYLKDEEVRIGIATETNKKIEQDWDNREKQEDSGWSTSVLQQLIVNILGLVNSGCNSTRSLSLEVLDISIKRGIISPIQCMDTVISCVSDASLLHKCNVLMNYMQERDPTFFVPAARRGFFKAYLMSLVAHSTETGLGAEEVTRSVNGYVMHNNNHEYVQSVHGPLYTIIQKTRKMRMEWMTEIIRHVVLDKGPIPSKYHSNTDVNKTLDGIHQSEFIDKMISSDSYYTHFSRFIVESVAFLPFLKDDEILHVLYAINTQVNYRANDLLESLDKLRKTKQSYNQANDFNVILQCVGIGHCLHLKALLKSRYNISEARVKKYVLDGLKEGPGSNRGQHDVHVANNHKMTHLTNFFSQLRSLSCMAENVGTKEDLDKFYKTVKNLLQTDAAETHLKSRGGLTDADTSMDSSPNVHKTKKNAARSTSVTKARKTTTGRKKQKAEEEEDELSLSSDAASSEEELPTKKTAKGKNKKKRIVINSDNEDDSDSGSDGDYRPVNKKTRK